MRCPECQQELDEKQLTCSICGFDLAMYKNEYQRIYNEKMKKLEYTENNNIQYQTVYKSSVPPLQSVHKPRCPYCNSESLTRITSLDKAVNIALFGIFGNKRKYQWHCNNCKTNW